MYIKLLCFFIVSLFNIGFAGTRDPNVPDAKYLEYGEKFNYVAKICGTYNDDTRFCGSAIIIDDHHVLTAAHVVYNSKSCSVYLKDREFCLKYVIIHKDFDNAKFGIADIAMGYSEKSFNLEFYPELYDKSDEVGKICSIAGYGLTGTFITGGNTGDNKRRAGSNLIDDSWDDLLVCSVRKVDKRKTSLEFLIASGDSGGGLFVDQKLAGINSGVMAHNRPPKSGYEEESGHTRISKFIPWITATRKKLDIVSE